MEQHYRTAVLLRLRTSLGNWLRSQASKGLAKPCVRKVSAKGSLDLLELLSHLNGSELGVLQARAPYQEWAREGAGAEEHAKFCESFDESDKPKKERVGLEAAHLAVAFASLPEAEQQEFWERVDVQKEEVMHAREKQQKSVGEALPPAKAQE